MSSISVDNISRPRDGNTSTENIMPFAIKPKSRTEVFSEIEKEISIAIARKTLLHDGLVAELSSRIENRSTSISELSRSAQIAKSMILNPNILSEHAQQTVVSTPPKITHHRNANFISIREGQKLFEDIAENLSKFTSGDAQIKFFHGIDGMNNFKNKTKWHINLLENLNKGNDSGIHSLNEVSQNDFVRFFGNTAQNTIHLPKEDQENLQKAAVVTLQKTKFPYKFDASSFQEALFVIQENMQQTQEFKDELSKFEEELKLKQ